MTAGMPGTKGTDTDRGVAVWTSAVWRERVTAWLDEQLVASAIERTGPVHQPRVRPWATVLTAPTTAGPLWLKACAPRTGFEVGLYQLLHRTVPDGVLAPLAADPARGWLLLSDGGPALGDRFAGDGLLNALVTALRQSPGCSGSWPSTRASCWTSVSRTCGRSFAGAVRAGARGGRPICRIAGQRDRPGGAEAARSAAPGRGPMVRTAGRGARPAQHRPQRPAPAQHPVRPGRRAGPGPVLRQG